MHKMMTLQNLASAFRAASDKHPPLYSALALLNDPHNLTLDQRKGAATRFARCGGRFAVIECDDSSALGGDLAYWFFLTTDNAKQAEQHPVTYRRAIETFSGLAAIAESLIGSVNPAAIADIPGTNRGAQQMCVAIPESDGITWLNSIDMAANRRWLRHLYTTLAPAPQAESIIKGGCHIKYLLRWLPLSVFESSILAIEAIGDVKARKDEQPVVVNANDPRDEWLYQQALAGVAYDVIQRILKSHKDWDGIDTIGGIRSAIKRYCERYPELPAVPSRQRGRKAQ